MHTEITSFPHNINYFLLCGSHGEEQETTHLISYSLILLEQLNPSPSVNGYLHEHVKFALSSPSLSQSALMSHGALSHGSGTINFYKATQNKLFV